MNFTNKHINMIVMLAAIFFISIVFSAMTNGIFFYPRNITLLVRQTTVVAILAIGMMFVIISGHIDLSVGSVLGLSGVVAAVLQVWLKLPTIVAISGAIGTGIICGIWHGYWVSYKKVPAFIITLGGLLIFKGAKLGISQSTSIAPMNQSFSMLGQSYIPASVSWGIVIFSILYLILNFFQERKSKLKYHFSVLPVWQSLLSIFTIIFIIIFSMFFINTYKGLPTPVLIMILIIVLFNFIANKTVLGRSIYAIGGNEEAALLSGIKTKKITMFVFILSGMLAAVAGIILTARLDASTPAAGDGMELDAIAACVIGGTSMRGGVGRILGVVLGALIMASLDNGMSLINLENFWQFIVKGLVLTLAVWVDSLSRRAIR